MQTTQASADFMLDVYRRHRKRAERHRTLRVEALDRLEQPQRRDLREVIQRLAAALVAARQRTRQRQEPFGQLGARGGVPGALVALEQATVIAAAAGTVTSVDAGPVTGVDQHD